MAAVASKAKSEGGQEPNGDHFSDSGPSFTAVNGSNSPAPPTKGKEQQKENSEDNNLRPLKPNNHNDRPSSPGPIGQGQSQASSHHEQRHSPPPEQAEDRPPHHFSHPHESVNDHSNEHSRTSSGQHSNNNNGNNSNGSSLVQKRKRSYPEEYETSNNAAAYHNHGLPPSPQRQRMYGQENGPGHDREQATPENYPRVDRGNPSELYGRADHSPPPAENYPQPERHQLVRNEYDNRGDGSIAPGRPYYSDVSDARVAEALQRENNNYEQMPIHGNQFGSPEDDDDQLAHQYGEYGGTPRTQAQRDIERTRRKRVFSNRTKTGCMTCRRRKKKCDEQHPECNNCLRGGFVCEGYTVRNTWQKPVNAKAPIPLQSKNGYPPQPMRNGPGYARYSQDPDPDYHAPPPMGQGIHVPHEGERMQPILVDEERNQEYKTSPPNGQPKNASYSKAARPYPSNPAYVSKYQMGEPGDEGPGSTHENGSYTVQDPNSMHPPPPVHRSNSTPSQYSGQSSHPPPHNNAQAVAQNALQHPAALRPSPHRRGNEMTEREKMLKGNYYSPFSPALTQDRENCMSAIWRFNNATNPSHGASLEERQRLFRAIMAMRPTPEPPITNSDGSSIVPAPMTSMPSGRVGENVVVEAPFHCDYGYNINIGNDVLIGADCRISDTCSVTIGDRCIFSPNVKLVCATYPIDPRRRQGSGGQALGRNIVIEEDCWIGSNVIILAGVRVGRSSTVGAGSLLHQDVPRFTVVAGNPAKVSRGIYDGSADGQ